MRVAVVGGGISGLGAVWLLNEHSRHHVELFEANDYVGGHTHTVSLPTKAPVDTGFIVFNRLTYPNFTRFLRLLGVTSGPSDMSFSVRRGSNYEWAGTGLAAAFSGAPDWRAQAHLFWDIIRFNTRAPDALRDPRPTLSVGEYLKENGYSEVFKRHYLLPMTSAIWSTPADKTSLLFPIKTLVQFLSNHHLLQVFGQPAWLTVRGGAQNYIDAILRKLPPTQVHTGASVTSIRREEDGRIRLLFAGSKAQTEPFDQVIFATHADETANILESSPPEPARDRALSVLSQFSCTPNHAVLHSDPTLMPSQRRCWTAWNYRIHEADAGDKKNSLEETVCLTYWMNRLQPQTLPESIHGPVFVSLNPPANSISPREIIGQWTYHHPVYSAKSVAAQANIAGLQTQGRMSYVGAWTGYGFHEDGLRSALRLLTVEAIHVFGVKCPDGMDPGLPSSQARQTNLWLRLILGMIEWFLALIFGQREYRKLENRTKES
ncbi:hypothetical protein CROQUDRAFT_41092 [Cronartium quercuum f. sp. fusiforme G11]|uniref:Amine oxidase domain-containing protein n=1 Tax=Cronartium quercuum f. sp. fusiforme G11 TaxID=708437 RepID=A0A9P6NS55_9BASI|nr:hypothetical protein CROQUDRAFT_41092 [Cronartium quercuum f. sp. fusiforme G11]